MVGGSFQAGATDGWPGGTRLLASTVCSVLRAAEHDLAPFPGGPPPVPGAECYTLLVGTGGRGAELRPGPR